MCMDCVIYCMCPPDNLLSILRSEILDELHSLPMADVMAHKAGFEGR